MLTLIKGGRAEKPIEAGNQESVYPTIKNLGEVVLRVADQWFKGTLDPKEEKLLIRYMKQEMPAFSDHMIRSTGPFVLHRLGELAMNGHLDQAGIDFLMNIVCERDDEKGEAQKNDSIDDELRQIEVELEHISGNWTSIPDPDGHYIDIIGHPRSLTSISNLDGKLGPVIDEVNVATVYLEEPRSELILNAEFIYKAPERIKLLIARIRELENRR